MTNLIKSCRISLVWSRLPYIDVKGVITSLYCDNAWRIEMFDGIILDVDGTLWDSTPIVEDAWNQALKDYGYPQFSVTAERLKSLFGLPMMDILKGVLPGIDESELNAFALRCYEYEHAYIDKTPGILYEGICEVIREISKTHPVFIVSNCQAGYIELFLKKTGLADAVKDHLCPGDTDRFKADNIRMIVNRYGLKNAVYVGDIQKDADASYEAGVEFVFAAYGFGSCNRYYASINKPIELLDIVG